MKFYLGTEPSKLGDVVTDDKTGELVRVTLYPAAENPDKPPKEKNPKGTAPTEWVVAHPTVPGAVIAMTSFWNKRPATMVCFKQSTTVTTTSSSTTTPSEEEDEEKEEGGGSTASTGGGGGGSLEKVFEMSTGGRQACHAMFHPNTSGEQLALAVAHYGDAMITFFQFPSKNLPSVEEAGGLKGDQPVLMIELPELVPGTRKTLGVGKFAGHSVPSCQHVYYAPNGKFLLCVDPNQSAIITYEVDDTGLPTKQEPTSTFMCSTEAPSPSWMGRAVGGVFRVGKRPRRVAVSPNGRFVFVSYEMANVIQVYAMDEETGQIDPQSNGCMQEISTLEESLTNKKVLGFTMQMSAELTVHDNALYVSNRGMGLGAVENSIKIFDIKDGGRLVVRQVLRCSGPVRHFCIMEVPAEQQTVEGSAQDGNNIVDGDAKDVLLVAGTPEPRCSLQTFRRHCGDSANQYELVGEADVGAGVLCVVDANVIQ